MLPLSMTSSAIREIDATASFSNRAKDLYSAQKQYRLLDQTYF